MKRAFLLFIVILNLSACSGKEEDVTLVSAAASLTDVLNEIEIAFEEKYPEHDIDFNFGGSGTLREQIKQGAPADFVIFASQKDFDVLGKSVNYLKKDALLENTLVLIAPKDNKKVTNIETLEKANAIAIGTEKSVPAGYYAKQAFDSLGLTHEIEDKFIYAEDVRAVLHYVTQGEVDAGVVYLTDALTVDQVNIIDTFEAHTHDKIVYPIGMLTDSETNNLFYEFLQTKEAKDIFKKYGFKLE